MGLYALAIFRFTHFHTGFSDFLTGDFLTAVAAFGLGASISYFREKGLRQQFRDGIDLATERDRYKDLLYENEQLSRRLQDSIGVAERAVAHLRRFFSPAVAEHILHEDGNALLGSHHRSNITVVFCDLRGWTDFNLRSEPEDVRRVLVQYHRDMGELINRYKGTVEHFAGDGLMVFFNDPVPISQPANQAVRMAVEMRQRAFALIELWQRQEIHLGFGVGIDQGYASVGTVGFEGRYDYSAIGPAVNRAARLCAAAQHGQILISRRVLDDVSDEVEVNEVGQLDLKGIGLAMAFDVTALRSIRH